MTNELISFEDALIETVEALAQNNARQWQLLRSADYSRQILGIPCAFAVHCGRGKNGYSFRPVNIGGEHRFIYTRLPLRAVMRIARYAGETGSRLFTREQLSGWGYTGAENSLPATEQERADERERAAAVQRAAETASRKATREHAAKKDYARPAEVKSRIERIIRCSSTAARQLTSEAYCRDYLGLNGPVLLPCDDVQRMLRASRKPDDIEYTRACMEIDGIRCHIIRLTRAQFRQLVSGLTSAAA